MERIARAERSALPFLSSLPRVRLPICAEVGIEALLKKLNDDANKVIGFKEHRESYKADPELMRVLFAEITDIQTNGFENGLAQLKKAMHSYLDFSKLYA